MKCVFKLAVAGLSLQQSLVASAQPLPMPAGDRASRPVARVGAPDEHGDSVPLSESEYADLKLYMNRAREVLEETLQSAQALGDVDLHRRLLVGVRSALEQLTQADAPVDMKNEKLVFRNVLSRGLELDSVFMHDAADCANDCRGSAVSAANVILIGSIHSSLNYYKTVDMPRFETALVPSPDWAAFVRDQLPIWAGISNTAPSTEAKREVILKTMAWALTDLNRSTNRRDYAKLIVNLGAMHKDLSMGVRTTAEAQQLLEKTATELRGMLATAQAPEASVGYPPSNYPGEAGRWNNDIFPLLQSSTLDGIDRYDNGAGAGSMPDSNFDHLAQLGSGGGIIGTNRDVNGFAALNARAHVLFTVNALTSNKDDVFNALHLYASAQGEAAFHGAPLLRLKVDGNASLWGIAGVYAAIEANKFNEFKELFMRLGYVPTFNFNLGPSAYIVVRGGGGVGLAKGDMFRESKRGKSEYVQFGAMLRIAKFMFTIEFTRDVSKTTYSSPIAGNAKTQRNALATALSIPLGVLFPNDALRIEGELINYRNAGESVKDLNIYKAGGYYEIRF